MIYMIYFILVKTSEIEPDDETKRKNKISKENDEPEHLFVNCIVDPLSNGNSENISLCNLAQESILDNSATSSDAFYEISPFRERLKRNHQELKEESNNFESSFIVCIILCLLLLGFLILAAVKNNMILMYVIIVGFFGVLIYFLVILCKKLE